MTADASGLAHGRADGAEHMDVREPRGKQAFAGGPSYRRHDGLRQARRKNGQSV